MSAQLVESVNGNPSLELQALKRLNRSLAVHSTVSIASGTLPTIPAPCSASLHSLHSLNKLFMLNYLRTLAGSGQQPAVQAAQARPGQRAPADAKRTSSSSPQRQQAMPGTIFPLCQQSYGRRGPFPNLSLWTEDMVRAAAKEAGHRAALQGNTVFATPHLADLPARWYHLLDFYPSAGFTSTKLTQPAKGVSSNCVNTIPIQRRSCWDSSCAWRCSRHSS